MASFSLAHTSSEVKYMENQTILNALTKLLEGTHMGQITFTDYLENLQNPALHNHFQGYLELLNNHEKALQRAILFYHGDINAESLKAMASEMMITLKNLMLSSDGDILKSAMKSIEMGLSQLKEFDDENLALTEEIRKDVKIMNDDYQSMKHQIHKSMLEFQ